jgi:hypothetical protein
MSEFVAAEAPLVAVGFAAALLQQQWSTRLDGGQLDGPDGERTVLVLGPTSEITLTVAPEVEWLPRFPLLVARALSQGRKAWAFGVDEASGRSWSFEVEDDAVRWAERTGKDGKDTWTRADEHVPDRAWRGDVQAAANRGIAAAKVGIADVAGLLGALETARATPGTSLRAWLESVGAGD